MTLRKSYSIRLLVLSKLLVFCPYLGAFKCFFQCHFMYVYEHIPSALEKEAATPPVFLPGKVHGQGSLVGYGLWDCKESDTTERTAHSTRHLIPLFLKGSLGFNHMEVPPRSYLQQISCISTLVEACCYASRKLVSGELEEHKNLFF